jgi:hypothetical protein
MFLSAVSAMEDKMCRVHELKQATHSVFTHLLQQNACMIWKRRLHSIFVLECNHIDLYLYSNSVYLFRQFLVTPRRVFQYLYFALEQHILVSNLLVYLTLQNISHLSLLGFGAL